MEKLTNIVSKINSLMESLKVENEKNLNGNKAAGKRARKISLELGNELKTFRAISVEANK